MIGNTWKRLITYNYFTLYPDKLYSYSLREQNSAQKALCTICSAVDFEKGVYT